MPPRLFAKASLTPVGFQTISLANTTAVAVNTTCRQANVLDVSVETTDARYRADGSDPTNSTGVLLTKANLYRFEGYNGTSKMKFARAGGSGTSLVHIMAWRHGPGPLT